MQRTVSFPACLSCGTYRAAIEFDYLVDSEAGHDWLRVFLDGVQQQEVDARVAMGLKIAQPRR